MEDKLIEISKRLNEIDLEMSKPEVVSDQNIFKKLNIERSQIAPVVLKYEEFKKLSSELNDSEELLKNEDDDEMKEMLQSEINNLKTKIVEYEQNLLILLLPKDSNSGKDIIMEIRAGTGGDEAALFAADLFRMYSRFADNNKWKIEYIDIHC